MSYGGNEKMNFKERIFSVVIDRPVGFEDSFGNVYPINYGYIPELMGGDGEEQDVYIVSHDQQQLLEVFTGKLVAIIRRRDDIEDKWVLAPLDEKVNKGLIVEQTYFMEQYFDSWIEMVEENNDLSKGGYK
ncbi:inorganic diphosphatase [Streptococcus sp. 27098_8_22]|uniref:inorganic diphosphatase n=1 Tax=Streptococcus sp. 27098_8_22 TaxID=3003665 RepID=UPI00352F9354